MVYIGIDPGKSGAIAVLWSTGTQDAWDMPEDEHGIVECLKDVRDLAKMDGDLLMAALEKVGAMPGQGVSSMFNFGQSVGILRGCLAALSIPFVYVTPQKWQKVVFDSAKHDDRKKASLELARRIYPKVKLERKRDHGKADALLIATWLKRQETGKP